MINWSVSDLSNQQIFHSYNLYKSTYLDDINNHKSTFSDIHIFVPFALYREHNVWEFYKKSKKSKIELLSSHLKWIDTRLDIFETFTLEGLIKSSLQAFTLHILIDTYEVYPFLLQYIQSRLVSLLTSCQFNFCIHSVRLFPMDEPYESYPSILAPKIKNTILNTCTDKIIIIRLDSDDTLLPAYLRTVDQIAHSYHTFNILDDDSRPLLIDLPYGIQFIAGSQCSYTCLWPESNLTALLTNHTILADNYIPFEFAHDEIPSDLRRTIVATHHPMWIQGIHATNVQNGLFPWSTKYRENFSLQALIESFNL